MDDDIGDIGDIHSSRKKNFLRQPRSDNFCDGVDDNIDASVW